MSRTGLRPADIAESFRDRCGDGSVEWVYTPMQTWVLLDAADMLDENAKLRDELDFCLKYAPNCDECAAMLDCDECLRADSSQKERKRLDYENAKLRNEFRKMDEWHSKELLAAVDNNKKLHELVVDMYACIKALCSMVENSPGCSMCLTNQDEEKPCAAADVYCRMTDLGVYE